MPNVQIQCIRVYQSLPVYNMQILATNGNFWQQMAAFRNKWQLFSTNGNFWQQMATFSNKSLLLAFSSAICFANILPCQRPLKCYNHRAHHLFSFFLLSSYHLNVYQMYVFISFSGWCNYESNVMDTRTLLFQCPANLMSFSLTKHGI